MSKQLDLSHRLKTRGTSGRAVLTQLIEPRTIDPRCRCGEEEKGDGGTTRGRKEEEGGMMHVTAVTHSPRATARRSLHPPCLLRRAVPDPSSPRNLSRRISRWRVTRRACTRDISSISRIKP